MNGSPGLSRARITVSPTSAGDVPLPYDVFATGKGALHCGFPSRSNANNPAEPK
jgi:hypothetical protein